MDFSKKCYGRESARSYNQHEMGIRNIQMNIGENVKLTNRSLINLLNALSAQYIQKNIGANGNIVTEEQNIIDLLQRGEAIDVLLKSADNNRLKIQEDLKTLLYQLKIVVTDLASMETNGGMLTQAVANGKMKQQTLDIIRAGSIQQTMVAFTDAVVEHEAVVQTMSTIIGRSNMAMVKISDDILTNTNMNVEADIRRLFNKNDSSKIKGGPKVTTADLSYGNPNVSAPGYEHISGADGINNVPNVQPVNTGGWGQTNPQPATGGWGQTNPQQNAGGWGTSSAQPATGGWGQTNPQPNAGGWGNPTPNGQQPTTGGWGTSSAQPATGGWGQTNPQPNAGGWGNQQNQQQPATGGWGQTNPQPNAGGWGGTSTVNTQTGTQWCNTGGQANPVNTGWNDVLQYKSSVTISDSSNSKDDDYSFC